jgi:hypothetical protein
MILKVGRATWVLNSLNELNVPCRRGGPIHSLTAAVK